MSEESLNDNQLSGRADIHMHTTASDGLSSVQELLDYVARRGHLDVIAITDHDTLDASLWAYEHRYHYPFEIIPGLEISSREGHVLALWVTHPVPMGLSLCETAAAVHEQGGFSILAHPFHFQLDDVYRNFRRYWRRPDYLIDAGIDGLEIHNAGVVIPGCNVLARHFARRLDVAVTAGSDAHSLGAIGSGVTRFPGHTATDLRHALEQRQTTAEGTMWPLVEYARIIRAIPTWQAPMSVREYLIRQEVEIEPRFHSS
jgi:predicted metal-dependent phosphoesterase TrpH